MSERVHVYYAVHCDDGRSKRCNKSFAGKTQAEANEGAYETGWRMQPLVGGDDQCPECRRAELEALS